MRPCAIRAQFHKNSWEEWLESELWANNPGIHPFYEGMSVNKPSWRALTNCCWPEGWGNSLLKGPSSAPNMPGNFPCQHSLVNKVIVSIIYIILALYYLVFGIYKWCKIYGKLSTSTCEKKKCVLYKEIEYEAIFTWGWWDWNQSPMDTMGWF